MIFKRHFFVALFAVALCSLVGGSVPLAVAQGGGPPTQEQVFKDENGMGHSFSDHYWDIIVKNNSYWEKQDDPEIKNMTTWLNNSWNILWVNEGNFEMGFFAFMNKSGIETRPNAKAFTPAQMWWFHYYYNQGGQAHEMLIGNMLTAWFGFNDVNHNQNYDNGEDLNPFFYMTLNDTNLEPLYALGLQLNTGVTRTPLVRSQNADNTQITYTWSYNYTNIGFFLPSVNQSTHQFNKGFDYSDPGTYLAGSFGFGLQEFIYYKYTLVLDNSSSQVTLYSDYISGDITELYRNESDTGFVWQKDLSVNTPRDWVLCIGTWSFIMAGEDEHSAGYSLSETTPGDTAHTPGDSINASASNWGLAQVTAAVAGTPVFDYQFSRKPNYVQYENGNSANSTTQAVKYAALGINTNQDFLNLVSGMTQLIGPFGRLVCAYAINQTNHFTDGITMEKADGIFDPNNLAALLVTAYPKFGEYNGGHLVHDPVFTAFWTPGSNWNEGKGIPGYSFAFIALFTLLGVSVIALRYRRR